MKPRQSDVKTRNKLARNGIVMTRTNGSIGISTTRMLKAAAKRDEASSQKTVMGISAPEVRFFFPSFRFDDILSWFR